MKFALGLFDNPYLDGDRAASVLAQPTFVAEGHRAQAESVTLLANVGLLPLRTGSRVYAEGVPRAALADFEVVERPEQADLALVRLAAPFEARDDLFLEAWFHQGHLDFQPGVAVRLERIAGHCPLVLDVTLHRPAILTPLLNAPAALTVSYGSSAHAWLDALTGRIPPIGRLPFDLPRSMHQVRDHPEDRPGLDAPLFSRGFGLSC